MFVFGLFVYVVWCLGGIEWNDSNFQMWQREVVFEPYDIEKEDRDVTTFFPSCTEQLNVIDLDELFLYSVYFFLLFCVMLLLFFLLMCECSRKPNEFKNSAMLSRKCVLKC